MVITSFRILFRAMNVVPRADYVNRRSQVPKIFGVNAAAACFSRRRICTGFNPQTFPVTFSKTFSFYLWNDRDRRKPDAGSETRRGGQAGSAFRPVSPGAL